ncbi:MAG: hypothetical protein K0Q94_563 [Paenibacillus sp.]|jgi:hypothetical protein|nr:hypothetical protein [Paenibacillus sp.]
MRQQRYDRAMVLDYAEDKLGYLTVNAAIARAGVFPYRRHDSGIVFEAKLPSDIFAEAVVQSARAKPVTDEHPPEMVTLDNHQQYSKGMSHTDARVDGDRLKVTLTVTDRALIDRVKSGHQKEISIGFLTDLIEEKGEYEGQRYDYKQTNIEINHIAIVRRGRAGPEVSIRADSAYEIENDEGGKNMPKYTIDGQEFEVPSEVKSHLDALIARLDAAGTKVKDFDALQGRYDALEADNGRLSTELEQAKKNSMTQDALDKAVNARVELLDGARKYLGDSFDFAGKSDREVKVSVIQKVKPDFKADGKSDEYLDAFYEASVERVKADGFSSRGGNHLFTGDGYGTQSQQEIDKMRADRLNIKNAQGGK